MVRVGQFLLDRQIELAYLRILEVLREEVQARCRELAAANHLREYRNSTARHRAEDRRHRVLADWASGSFISVEHDPVRNAAIVKAVSRVNHRLAAAERIPRNADARADIVVVDGLLVISAFELGKGPTPFTGTFSNDVAINAE